MTSLEEKMNDDRDSLEAERAEKRTAAEKAFARALDRTLMDAPTEDDEAARAPLDAAKPTALDDVTPHTAADPTPRTIANPKKKKTKRAQ